MCSRGESGSWKGNPYSHGDSKIPLLLNKVRSLLGHCVVSMQTSNVNGMSSIYLTNNTSYIMLFHHIICTHDVSKWLADLLFGRAG